MTLQLGSGIIFGHVLLGVPCGCAVRRAGAGPVCLRLAEAIDCGACGEP